MNEQSYDRRRDEAMDSSGGMGGCSNPGVVDGGRSGTAQLFRRVDGTTWPLVGETGWQLRYAPDAVNRLHAASIVSAYAHLTDPGITQKDAVAALRRARQAVRDAS